MADPTWFIQGKWLEYCSCDYGCPCESMAESTRGTCDGVVAMHIDEGYFGDVRLDGLNIVATFFFPRAIHHGQGQMHPILDESSTPEQRDAISKILSGEGQPVGTIFQIFSVIVEKLHEPKFLPITFEWDIERRAAQLEVPGIVRASTTPIRNPVTDKEHRPDRAARGLDVLRVRSGGRHGQRHGPDQVRLRQPPQLARPVRVQQPGHGLLVPAGQAAPGHAHLARASHL
jgi:hypothetical protein